MATPSTRALHRPATTSSAGWASQPGQPGQPVITQAAVHATARAHPEAEHVRAQARVTDQAAKATRLALIEVEDDLAEKLLPCARVAYHHDLPGALAETKADLDTLNPQVDAANQRVRALTHAPEIRALPVGRLDAERDQWSTHRQAAQEAARAAVLQRAALEHESQTRRRLHSTHRTPSYGDDRSGPGIGF
ncbi:MAG: hypothetical protein ACR2FG_05850 [Marmoricola sp.]